MEILNFFKSYPLMPGVQIECEIERINEWIGMRDLPIPQRTQLMKLRAEFEAQLYGAVS